jgi:signal transduction histidine kinase
MSRRRRAEQLRRVRAEIVATEREWLARELHDSVMQALYTISLRADTASERVRRGEPAQAQESIAGIHQTAVAGLTDLRGLILQLVPGTLAGNGLNAALTRLLDTLHTPDGCRTVAQLGPEPPVGLDVRQALYRIAQEAVQNAARHAYAAHVTLRLATTDTDVVLEVADDGRGFTPSGDAPGRLGVRSMHERAASVGGRLDITSAPGTGTTVRATVPLARVASHG